MERETLIGELNHLANGRMYRLVDYPYNDYEPGEVLALSDLKECRAGGNPMWFEPPYMSSSDYAGDGAIGIANRRAFLELYGEIDGVEVLQGGYSYETIIVRIDAITDDMLDTLKGLSDYPLIDDESLSEVEMELQEEAWKSWVESEFRSELVKRFGIEVETQWNPDTGEYSEVEAGGCVDSELIDEVDGDKLRALFDEKEGYRGGHWIDENGGQWIRVTDIVELITESEILELCGVKSELPSTSPDQLTLEI